eukprot:Transcript_2119.p1 GENE.Transcript_2119~~Transcript_2119.p1  ORF type:complete len:404 (-),score=107.84 Transcript_2119:132-1250(-)
MFVRAAQRVPWQVSGALGWGALASLGTLAEVGERESPARAAAYGHSPLTLDAGSLEELRTRGYLVIDGALDDATLVQARADCASLQSAGSFVATEQHDESLRSDAVHWVHEEARPSSSSPSATPSAGPGLLAVLRRLRALALQLERKEGGWPGFDVRPRAVDLGVPMAAQLARYSAPGRHAEAPGADAAAAAREAEVTAATGGARYTAHRDGRGFGSCSPPHAMLMPGICMREATCILYLSDWGGADGGGGDAGGGGGGGGGGGAGGGSGALWPPRRVASGGACCDGSLVLYLDAAPSDESGRTATSVLEILPVGGRLVIFDSRRVLHEVRPHTRLDVDRLAMTLWIGGAHSASGLLRHCLGWWLGWWPAFK